MKKETKNPEVNENEAAPSEEKVVTAPVAEASVSPMSPCNLPKIGSTLKDARLKKGMQISEVSQALCIRKGYLEAIENSNYDNIPDYPYGIGFIRSYAEYLGLNGAQIVQLYKNETDANANKNNQCFVPEPQAEASVPGKKYLLLSLLGIFAIYFGWYAFNESQNRTDTEMAENVSAPANDEAATDLPLVVEDYAVSEETVPAVDAPVAEEAVPVIDTTAMAPAEGTAQVVMTNESFDAAKIEKKPAAEAVPAAAEEAKPAADKSDSRIVIKVKKDTWIEVKDGSKLYLSKVLLPGEIYNVPNGAGMILSVGKADGVEVLVDGKATPVVLPNKKMNIELDGFLNH